MSKLIKGLVPFVFVLLVTPVFASQQVIMGDVHGMKRLSSHVSELCDELTTNVKPGTVSLAWHDNLHPESPMLSEAYMASLLEKELIRRGFALVCGGKKKTDYNVLLVMTPSRERLISMTRIMKGSDVISTAHGTFLAKENERELLTHRYRTKTIIPLGGLR